MTHYLKSLDIEEFKGFFEKETIDFAIPNGKKGSGLTIILGPNNSGKSTILECFKKFSRNQKFANSERHGGRRITLTLSDSEGGKKSVSNIEGGSLVSIFGQSNLDSNSFEWVPSRRHWSTYFNGQESYLYDNYLQSSRQQDKNSNDGALGNLLNIIHKNSEKKPLFLEKMRKVVPHFNDWSIDTNDHNQDYIDYHTYGGGPTHHTGLLGDGVTSLFRIVSHIIQSDSQRILVLDEPELSLHPQAQKGIANLLSEMSTHKQVIIATHSPHFVLWTDIRNGAQIIRTSQKEKGQCKTYQLKENGIDYEKLLTFTEQWQKPYILDVVAKELFFSQNVLFLEGQEDVGLIKKFCDEQKLELNFELFGYGAGGAGNIQTFLKLAKSLGIKSGAVFDGDQQSNSEKCKHEFPIYKIEILIEQDIRDKINESHKITKEGIFSASGEIKSKHRKYMLDLIKDFNDWFMI